MPGLIDVHVHLFLEGVAGQAALFEAGAGGDALVQQVFRAAAESSTQMLMNGFTSARDMAGPVFELKKAIDQGQLAGPRLWPSGAMISQTSGHGYFRTLDELPRTPTSELSLAER
ncbi:amidohydrolase family protein [Thermoleptolyngbya sichuanensis XZ-Cy5]|nr:amidohydrolase family protein [Thermoleptolyngbya sichuanensis]MDG2614767.1 amidohydrolase family protein [Thermoleptolyngbya sichuanensis XZ-Cy5]